MDPGEKKKFYIYNIYGERQTERQKETIRLILLVEPRGLQGTNIGLRLLIPLPITQLSYTPADNNNLPYPQTWELSGAESVCGHPSQPYQGGRRL